MGLCFRGMILRVLFGNFARCFRAIRRVGNSKARLVVIRDSLELEF